MEKLLESIRKFDTPLLWGIASLLFGILFILLPSSVLDIILLITGILVIILSLLRLISLLATPKRTVPFVISVVLNALIFFFGISLSMARSDYAHSICTTLGVYLSVLSFFRLVTSYRTPAEARGRSWWVDTVIACLMLAVGLWLVIYPVWPKILAGVALIVLSAEFFIRTAKRSASSGIAEAARDVFEGSFVDRSDE